MGKLVDLTGKTYGDLEVLGRAGCDERGEPMWLCRCKCGNFKIVHGSALRYGKTKSCGCGKITHGGSSDPLYKTHYNMLDRCYNPKCESYPHYGERGIKVCDEWHICTNFFKWAYANGYKPGLTLDRIDVDGDYCPENCRWVTMKEQQNNKTNNCILTINGKTQTLAEHIADLEINIYQLDKSTVKSRFYLYKWPAEKVFSTPAGANWPTYTIKGKTQTLAQHIADPEINIYNLKECTVWARIFVQKRSAEESFSTPLRGKRGGQIV